MAVKIQFEIGHTSKLKIKKTREGFTHDWELYVKGVNGADIACFVEKVVFNLDDSFPKPKRVCKEPPYMIQESGYAGFMLPIDIYLRNRDEPKMLQFNYDLALHTVGPPQHRSDIQKYIFENPSEEFRQKLMKGGGIPVAGVTSGGAITTPLLLAHNQENHKSVMGESKKHKSRSEELKAASFSDLFGPPITKGTCPIKQSPDYRSSISSSNQMISKSNSHLTQSSASSSNLNKEKLSKEKNFSSGSNSEKSKDRQERKEKHAKISSITSPQKEGGRSTDSKSKHDRRDKTDDKSKKEKTRDKDKDRNRSERNSSGNLPLQGTTATTTLGNNTSTSMTPSGAVVASSLKRPSNSSPKREVAISPSRNSPAALTLNATHLSNPNARPSSSNGSRFETDGKTITRDPTKPTKDTAGSIEMKSKESKGRDVNANTSSSTSTSSSSKKSKKERKEKDKDKDKDKERDKEKQKSTDTNQASRVHNQHFQNTNSATDTSNTYNIENKSSKPIAPSSANANVNAVGNIEMISMKREKSSNHKAATATIETKSMEKIIHGGSQPTLSSAASTTISLNSNQVEKSKISSSNNTNSSTTAGGSGAPSIQSATAGSGTSSVDNKQDKQRSHKHKKRDKNKDRDREKERERDKDKDRDRDRDRDKERDKDKDLKKEEKKEKDKHEKPFATEAKVSSLNNPLLGKATASNPSLSNLLEENNTTTVAATAAATISSSNHKKSQHNRDKKSRDKSASKEERSKRKQNELNEITDGGAAKGNKQIKLSSTNSGSSIQAIPVTSPSLLSTSEHSQANAVATTSVAASVTASASISAAQTTMDLSDNDSLAPTSATASNLTISATTTSIHLTPNEQLRNNNKSKTSSHLVHSDSSNSACSTDMSQQHLQQTATIINNNSNNRTTESTKITNATCTPSTNSMNGSRDTSKNTGIPSNKVLKEKLAQTTIERSGNNKADKMGEKRRRRSSGTNNTNNTFIEPPLKQIKKDKEQQGNKGALRDKWNKSPLLVARQATTTTTTMSRSNSCTNLETANTFLQPSASPSLSNATSAVNATVVVTPTTTTSTAQLSVASGASVSANKMASPSPVINATEGAIMVQQQQAQMQQQSGGNILAPPQLPPQMQTQIQTQSQLQPTQSQSIVNTLSTDYWSELQELQQKIMMLQDSEDLQHVVELIAATGCYEITTKTFDFDLCKLDRNTVQRLQDFFAASVA